MMKALRQKGARSEETYPSGGMATSWKPVYGQCFHQIRAYLMHNLGLISLTLGLCLFMAGCTQHPTVRVLYSMKGDQASYFKNETVPAFEKKVPSLVELIDYGDSDSLEMFMKLNAGKLSLVKVPFDLAGPLMRKGVFATLNSLLSEEELKKFEREYLLTSLGAIDGRKYLIPGEFETNIMIYCKSKVSDAIASWRRWKDSIDVDLRRYNGYGLPSTYLLESDPQRWDYFDLFVIGWIWSHTPYKGRTSPRIGLCASRNCETSLRIIDRVFQLGGDSSAVISMNGDAVIDAFFWEAVYTSAGIYNEKMWSERWSRSDILSRLASEEIFLSFASQADCFILHGTGSDNLDGILKSPDDMGISTLPRGCAALLDANGMPRYGKKAVATGGWWWGIPADAPHSRLGLDLAMFTTGTIIQIQECSRFGKIPVRRDILSDMSMMFGSGWIADVYETSFRQLVENGYTILPTGNDFNEIERLYLDCIEEIIVKRNWASDGDIPQRDHIQKVITSFYQSKAIGYTRDLSKKIGP